MFPTVRSEGGLLPPHLLQRIVEADADLGPRNRDGRYEADRPTGGSQAATVDWH